MSNYFTITPPPELPEGLVFERLFNFLGDLEDRLNKLEASPND